MTPTITTLGWAPPPVRGLIRDVVVRWAFEEVGQSYEVRLVDFAHIKSGEHRCLQPFGQVPTYTDDEMTLFETGAITLRIAERSPGLLPADPAARLRAIGWMFAALSSIEPWIMQFSAVNFFERDEPWSPLRRPKVTTDLQARLADLEAALGDGPWLDGETFTLGDVMMVWTLYRLRRTDMLGGYPRLDAYVARGEARPAFVKAMADHMAAFDNPQAA